MKLRMQYMQRVLDAANDDHDAVTTAQLARHDFETFALAGHAIVTIKNTKSGNRFTYKVRQCDDKPGLYFVGILTGSDNTSDYEYLGTISHMQYALGRKSRISVDAMSHQAFRYCWDHRANLPDCVEIWHEGRCARCGRVLTVPESIASGFGPECLKKRAA